MKYLVVKYKKMLFNFVKFEIEKLKLKVLFLNIKMPFLIRQKAYFLVNFFQKSVRLTKLQYRCLLTNKSRSVYKFFKLFRFQLKLQFYKSFLVGLKKRGF